MPLIDVQYFSRRAESLVVGRHLGHDITYINPERPEFRACSSEFRMNPGLAPVSDKHTVF